MLAIFYGTGPILLAAFLCAVIWDYFFIPPQNTLHIEKTEDMLMLIMFFIIALLNGILTSRVRNQEKKIRIREERTFALYQLSKELANAPDVDEVTQIAVRYVQKYFKLDSAILLKNEANLLETHLRNETGIVISDNDKGVAEWVFKHSCKSRKVY